MHCLTSLSSVILSNRCKWIIYILWALNPSLLSGTSCDIVCKSDAANETYFTQHPTDCRKYYKCLHGEPVLYTCKATKYYSQTKQKCVSLKAAKCNTSCITNTPGNTTSERSENAAEKSKDAYKLKHFMNYIMGKNKKNQSSRGEDTKLLPKGAPNLGVTTEQPSDPKLPTKDYTQPDNFTYCGTNKCNYHNDYKIDYYPTNDCTKYCYCDWGLAYEMQCPDNMHFNQKLGECDDPAYAGCVKDNLREKDAKRQPQPEPISDGCDNNKCPLKDGLLTTYFPHNDCESFCICREGIAYKMVCPGGLSYNSQTRACDWPEKIKCSIV